MVWHWVGGVVTTTQSRRSVVYPLALSPSRKDPSFYPSWSAKADHPRVSQPHAARLGLFLHRPTRLAAHGADAADKPQLAACKLVDGRPSPTMTGKKKAVGEGARGIEERAALTAATLSAAAALGRRRPWRGA